MSAPGPTRSSSRRSQRTFGSIASSSSQPLSVLEEQLINGSAGFDHRPGPAVTVVDSDSDSDKSVPLVPQCVGDGGGEEGEGGQQRHVNGSQGEEGDSDISDTLPEETPPIGPEGEGGNYKGGGDIPHLDFDYRLDRRQSPSQPRGRKRHRAEREASAEESSSSRTEASPAPDEHDDQSDTESVAVLPHPSDRSRSLSEIDTSTRPGVLQRLVGNTIGKFTAMLSPTPTVLGPSGIIRNADSRISMETHSGERVPITVSGKSESKSRHGSSVVDLT